jgi:hypothetical protein
LWINAVDSLWITVDRNFFCGFGVDKISRSVDREAGSVDIPVYRALRAVPTDGGKPGGYLVDILWETVDILCTQNVLWMKGRFFHCSVHRLSTGS